jgi:hypothetical protein
VHAPFVRNRSRRKSGRAGKARILLGSKRALSVRQRWERKGKFDHRLMQIILGEDNVVERS